MVDIWSIFRFFVWWSIFDKTPVAGLLCLKSSRLLPTFLGLDDRESNTCVDLTDVTLVDEDTNSILTDNGNRAIGQCQLRQ